MKISDYIPSIVIDKVEILGKKLKIYEKKWYQKMKTRSM